MLVNKAIANLFNGISQQPPTLRLASQCELLENANSSVANGLSKRNPTSVLSTLDRGTASASAPSEAFYKDIVRSAEDRLLLSIEYDAYLNVPVIRLYDLVTGTMHTPDVSAEARAYLNGANPRDNLVALTVADFTFILNKSQFVAMTSEAASGTFKGSKQKFSDLPTSGQVNGDVWEIIGTEASLYDNYYVKWISAKGVWAECVKPALQVAFNNATLPVALKPKVLGGYEIVTVDWIKRQVGDDISTKVPSFVGQRISDIFFYRNRLGFTSQENIILSRAGDFFNFFGSTARAQVDDDPIDVAVSHIKNANINFAVPFNTVLLLFSDGVQFQLTSQAALTPKTVNVTQTTEFDSRGTVRPVVSGKSLYFAVDRKPWTSIKEYFVEPLTYVNNALDSTAHCPQYIPQGVFQITSTTADDIVSVLTETDSSSLYVYRYYEDGDKKKLQSAWSKWKFGSGQILYHVILDNTVFMVVNRAGTFNIEALPLSYGKTEADLNFLVHLDRKVSLAGVYDAPSNTTHWNLPAPFTDGVKVVRGGGFSASLRGVVIPSTQVDSLTVQAAGNHTAALCYVGEPYTMRYRFSEQFYKTENSAVLNATLKLRKYRVAFQNTAYFQAKVTPLKRDTYTYTYIPNTVGGLQFGQPSLASGDFTFPVMAGADVVTVDIESDSYLPVTLHSAEWEGYLQAKGRRI